MRLFELTVNPNDWYHYQIEGEHHWSLPPLICDACGSRWKTIGEASPTVDVAWHQSWTMFLQRDAVRKLQDRGVKLPPCAAPRLTPKGTAGLRRRQSVARSTLNWVSAHRTA